MIWGVVLEALAYGLHGYKNYTQKKKPFFLPPPLLQKHLSIQMLIEHLNLLSFLHTCMYMYKKDRVCTLSGMVIHAHKAPLQKLLSLFEAEDVG